MNQNDELKNVFEAYRKFPKFAMNEDLKRQILKTLTDTQVRTSVYQRRWKEFFFGLAGLGIVVGMYFAAVVLVRTTQDSHLATANSANISRSGDNPVVLSTWSVKTIEAHYYSDYNGSKEVGLKAVLSHAPFIPVIPSNVPLDYHFNGIVLRSIPIIADPSQLGETNNLQTYHVGQVQMGYATKTGETGIAVTEQRNFGLFYPPHGYRKTSINGHPVWLSSSKSKEKEIIFYKGPLWFNVSGNAPLQDMEKIVWSLLNLE